MQLPTELKNVTVAIEHWTVAKAKLALTRNKTNRPQSQENIVFISSAMKRKKFMFTGESVIIATNDDLMNGQHRLESLVITGEEQWFVTVRGVNPKAFAYMDIGKTRSAGDALSIENIVNPGSYAAIGKLIILYNRGGLQKMSTRDNNKKLMLSPADISDFVLKQHPSLTKSREYGFAKGQILMSGNLLTALHFIFKKIDNDSACDFCNKFIDGKELEKNDPIFILREEFKAEIRSQRRMELEERLALVCLAWNAYRKDKKISSLKWSADKDEFPKPL